jgi:hypothetical protein
MIFFSQTYHLHPDTSDTSHGGHASGDIIGDFADLQEYEIVLHGLSSAPRAPAPAAR